MLTAMHRIAWWRALIAHVLGGVIALAIPIGGVWAWSAFLYAPMFSGPSLSPAAQAGSSLATALRQVRTPGQNEHLIDLLVSQPYWALGMELIADATIAPPEIMVGPMTLGQFVSAPGPEAPAIRAELSAAMLPSGIHRLGHIVVCDAGVNLSNVQSTDLWIAIVWPDPDSGAAFIHPETVVVVLASGTAQDIPLAQFPADLASQNAMRASLGIPEIPDPATVRMWPPGSAYAPNPQPAPPPAPVP
jgi:hypothetical protein